MSDRPPTHNKWFTGRMYSLKRHYEMVREASTLYNSTIEFSEPPIQDFNEKISLIQADITTVKVHAIVNAANKSLLGGGGVDGAIHRAAGPELRAECATLGGCEIGEAKITDSYDMKTCKKIIHTVGPKYARHEEHEAARLLANAYENCLALAVQNRVKSIAFSTLSTGVYGYPSMEAAPVALKAVRDFLEGPDGDKIKLVVFCAYEDKDMDAYLQWLPAFFPPVDGLE